MCKLLSVRQVICIIKGFFFFLLMVWEVILLEEMIDGYKCKAYLDCYCLIQSWKFNPPPDRMAPEAEQWVCSEVLCSYVFLS